MVRTKGTFHLFVSAERYLVVSDRGDDRPARFIIIAPDDFSAYSGTFRDIFFTIIVKYPSILAVGSARTMCNSHRA